MKLVQRGAVLMAVVLAAGVTLPAAAQRSDSYTWKLGIDAGIMTFETQTQKTKVVPTAGAHILVMGRRGGLMFGVDEGIGSNQNTIPAQLILFNDVRRYQAVLMAFPISGPIEPYFGGGGGILQVVGPRVDPAAGITDPTETATLLSNAQQESASAFATFVGGLQGRAGRMSVFVQYQATTSPSSDNLLKGPTQTLVAGLRFNLGSAREGVKAGGY
jgi:hypothetical protein